ncbi:protein OSCP1 [Lucilia cuprina]|uniref:protein OSCP1 n=1 Tax=Lucilia cuprina TaxID=7375 RepID=UPI001F054F30|nr:protein OSCP1 [Lucilia cuprina]
MTSFSHKLNPRANVFILVNLGCEMLFVIDQRLKAQQIALDKSIQVIHDVTAVLLEPKFIDSLIVGSTQPNAQLLTEEHCKFMLKDIATCSLMRLDDVSMDKLWNLMTMIYKWQLFQSKQQYHLMDITFRHLQGIGNFYPDEKRSMLIDFTKNTLLDFWNSCTDEEQHAIYRTNKAWLEVFNTKISLLIRLGFQALDGTFFAEVDASYYQDFKDCIGNNIYVKSAEIAELKKQQLNETSVVSTAKCVNQLAEMLNFPQTSSASGNFVSNSDDFKPINVREFQKNYEQNLQQCNILFEDLDVNGVFNTNNASCSSEQQSKGFVHLNPVYNKQLDVTTTTSVTAAPTTTTYAATNAAKLPDISAAGLNKDLLDLYSKIN